MEFILAIRAPKQLTHKLVPVHPHKPNIMPLLPTDNLPPNRLHPNPNYPPPKPTLDVTGKRKPAITTA